MDTPHRHLGLDQVIVADTAVSRIDGAAGRLVIAGRDVADLAANGTFERAAAGLWTGDERRVDEIRERLAAARERAHRRLEGAPSELSAIERVRADLARLRASGDDVQDAVAAAATLAVSTAAASRARRGQDPIDPDPSLGHVSDLHRMSALDGEGEGASALERYLLCVCDHGLNASTFAARVVTSTGSDAVSAVLAALGALKGPLHGGAPGPVLDMLDAVDTPERAEAWIRDELDAGRRIMGFGHRVYRVRDPRADVLEAAVRRLGAVGRLPLARAIQDSAERALDERRPGRCLRVNVEFMTAVLLDAIGVDRSLFTCFFAAGRVLGWCAHVIEERRVGRLIRPSSHYVGALPAPDGLRPQ